MQFVVASKNSLTFSASMLVSFLLLQRDGGNDHKEPTESWAQNLLKSSKGDPESTRPAVGDSHVPIQIIHSFMQKSVRPDKVCGRPRTHLNRKCGHDRA